jgi:hypothetical protein
MTMSYAIDHDLRLVTITCTGLLSAVEVTAFQKHISVNPQFRPTYGKLVDLRNASLSALDPGSLRRIAERIVMSPNSRRAYVVASDLQGFIVRMHALHAEIAGYGSGAHPFTDVESALAWLSEGSGDLRT